MDTSQSPLTESSTTTEIFSTSQDYLSLPPSSTKHVWGRVLALGSCSVKVRRREGRADGIPCNLLARSVSTVNSIISWNQCTCTCKLRDRSFIYQYCLSKANKILQRERCFFLFNITIHIVLKHF